MRTALPCLALLAAPLGALPELELTELRVGRVVDVHATDASTGTISPAPVHRRVLVGAALPGEGAGYRIETDAVTGEQRMVIAADSRAERRRYERILHRAMASAQVVDGSGEWGIEGPDAVPRNGALQLRFNESLRTERGASELLSIELDGTPLSTPGVTYSTIPGSGAANSALLIDFGSAPLPSAASAHRANLRLSLPAQPDPAVGRFAVLEGLSGDTLAGEVAVQLRSGIGAGGTLPDREAPQVVSQQEVTIVAAQDVDNQPFGPGLYYEVWGQLRNAACAEGAEIGDVLELPAGTFRVVRNLGSAGPALLHLIVQCPDFDARPAPALIGDGLYLTPFDPGDDPSCYVRFVPAEQGQPLGTGIDPLAEVELRFNEPMELGSVQALDSFMITEDAVNPSDDEVVAAHVIASEDGTTFRLAPLLPLAHVAGLAEPYYVAVNDGVESLTDLAGNGLEFDLPVVPFTLDPSAPTQGTGSVTLRFSSADGDGNGAPELRGQFFGDYAGGVVTGRPVVRFTGSTERTSPVPGLMSQLPGGVQTPLSPLGSKLMNVWRHIDFLFNVEDEALQNLDVEGLAWQVEGGVLPDFYPEFEIALSHSYYFPDEYVHPVSNLPDYVDSGLRKGDYANNLLGFATGESVLEVVHSREKGYIVDPADVFDGPSGSAMVPYPWNSDANPADDTFFTWRDTAVTPVGGPFGVGVEPAILASTGLIQLDDAGGIYTEGSVPSIGLPLLMQFSCFPTDEAHGLNTFDVSLAVNSSGQPNFRLFSTGGIDASGAVITKDPDLEFKGTGGFNPANGGAKTKGFDNIYYHGAADFVLRVSRSHTIWFDAGAPADFSGIVLEPALDPEDFVIEFRGASAIEDKEPGASQDAGEYDAYGNPYTPDIFPFPITIGSFAVQYLDDDQSWKSSVDGADGARYLQMRLTIFGDTVTGDVPSLSGIGVGYETL